MHLRLVSVRTCIIRPCLGPGGLGEAATTIEQEQMLRSQREHDLVWTRFPMLGPCSYTKVELQIARGDQLLKTSKRAAADWTTLDAISRRFNICLSMPRLRCSVGALP